MKQENIVRKKNKSILDWIAFFLEKLIEVLKVLIKLDLVLLIYWGVPYIVLRWSQHQHPAFYITAITIIFIYFFGSLWLVSHKSFYNSFEKNILGVLFPLMLIITLVWVGCTCFAALSSILSDYGAISFDPSPQKQNFEPLVEFYFWHFCNLLPQIEINETLEWKLQFQQRGNLINWLLLFFKAITIWIIIDLFYKWNEWRKEKNKKEDSKVNPTSIPNS